MNGWFIIEILSFYGYILSAIIFIIERSLRSSFGAINREAPLYKEVYKFDFLAYHKKDLDWRAFVTILTTVNLILIYLDEEFIFVETNPHINMNQA